MNNLKELELWFVTGSQDLYGEETLKQVAEHSKEIAGSLHQAKEIPVSVVFKPTVKSTEEIFFWSFEEIILCFVKCMMMRTVTGY